MNDNIPGYFHVAQGVAPVRPVTPGYEHGGELNVPGYDEGGKFGLHNTLLNKVSGKDVESFSGAGGGAPQPQVDPNSRKYYDIASMYPDLIGSLEDARQLYNSDPAYYDALIAAQTSKLLGSGGGGGGSSDATAYAQIAENARQFDLSRRDSQAIARQDAAVTREKMMQDYYSTLEAMKAAKKQAHNDAVTGALNAWSQNVGQANIPGIENYDQFADPAGSSQILGNAPVLRFNPMEAYGRQQSQQTAIPTPNIPSPVFE